MPSSWNTGKLVEPNPKHVSITEGTLVTKNNQETFNEKSKFADRATVVEPEVDDTFPLSDKTFNSFADTIGQLESSGRYDIMGGSSNAYDGKYQMGRMAKADAAKRLGITLKHDAEGREAFRQNPELQEDAFEAFTMGNHETLMRLSNKYKSSSRAKKAEALAVAHLLGAGGAIEYLNGTDGKDGFGTAGSKYAEAIKTALSS